MGEQEFTHMSSGILFFHWLREKPRSFWRKNLDSLADSVIIIRESTPTGELDNSPSSIEGCHVAM